MLCGRKMQVGGRVFEDVEDQTLSHSVWASRVWPHETNTLLEYDDSATEIVPLLDITWFLAR